MQATIQKTDFTVASRSAVQGSLWKRFVRWADAQQESRLLWTAIAIISHGCFFTIITMVAILFTGNHFIFWPFAIAAMSICVVTNLSAMPTRITIPVFFFSLLIDLIIIILCLANGFDAGASYR